MKIIDISPLLSPKTAVYPGDQPFSSTTTMAFASGDHLGLSHIKTTVHIGAHADAPSHYHRDGESIDQRELSPYFGPCEVIRLNPDTPYRQGIGGGAIVMADLGDLPKKCENRGRILGTRILFATQSYLDPDQWQADFRYFSPQVLEFLATQGVTLVGIDTPSVDASDSKELAAHQVLFRYNMSVLEGLQLQAVPAGNYFLSALPLRLAGLDAAPVRAVLVPLEDFKKSLLNEGL